MLSVGVDQLPSVLRRVNDAWRALGASFRDPEVRTGRISTSARMCLAAARNLSAGDRLDASALAFAFPIRGIPVEHVDMVMGWTAVRDVLQGEPIGWGDIRA